MDERNYAVMEAEMIASVDEYISARPQLDSIHNRRIYEAGFKSAYKKLERQLAAEREARQRVEENCKKFMALAKANEQIAKIAQHRADRAEARIKASQEQEPVAAVELITGAFVWLTDERTNLLFASPIIPPEVEALQRENRSKSWNR